MNKEDEGQAKAWPPFERLDAGVAPAWLSTSIAELIAAHGDRLERVVVELWGTYHYCDEHVYNLLGEITPVWKDFHDRPSEDDLDHVPAMRRMGRLACDLWDNVPMDLDEEGGLSGELNFVFDRNGVTYTWDTYEYSGGCDYEASARYENGAWSYSERIKMIDVEVSETSLAVGNTDEILGQIDPTEAGIKEWPKDLQLTHEIDENEDFVIIAPTGGLFEAYERSVA